ncbi:hypothetical protein BDV95DRAFT_440484, partial [Massariosphaeria phaeospora]
PRGKLIDYFCIMPNCGVSSTVGTLEPMRCQGCGIRMLAKVRTKRMVQFEAR